MHLLQILLLTSTVRALELDITSVDSICEASSLVAEGLLDYYEGTKYGGVVGMFTYPYYWWQAGHAFGALIDNWYYCQNTQYSTLIYDGLMAQRGENNDYIPKNQSMTEGNDDQGFWGLTVIAAAERNFTAPEEGPDWLALTQAVYNTMLQRWDMDHCGGGLRWQIFTWNSGYNYKNTISQACLFQIAGRLARFTGNTTYVETAHKVYDWLHDIGFIETNNGIARVYDGANVEESCTDIVKIEWSYNIGILLGGAAYLYNATEDSYWYDVTSELLQGSKGFARENIIYERACQGADSCNNDQRFFKGVFARCLGLTTLLVPELYQDVREILETSANAAAKSCSGGTDGHTCGLNWETGNWDGMYGLGEQVSALETFSSLLVPLRDAPFTFNDSGVAEGDTDAGLNSGTVDLMHPEVHIQTKDRAGAAIITAILLGMLVAGTVWMVW